MDRTAHTTMWRISSRTIAILLLATIIGIGFTTILLQPATVQASSPVHIFYYGSTSLSGCAIKCEQLATTPGTADIATSINVGKSTGCCFEVRPDTSGAFAIATPSDTTPTGQAWVYSFDLGGATIPSGTWQFDTTMSATATGTASMRFIVWSCLTVSEGACGFLFDFSGSANIESTVVATKYTDTSPAVGPFSNLHFLAVEVWINPTVAVSSSSATDTMTTVSSASDVITPATSSSDSPVGSGALVASLIGLPHLYRSLSDFTGLAAVVSVNVHHASATSTGVSCSKTKGSLTCTANVTSLVLPTTPAGSVSWTSSGTGTFSPASCSVIGNGSSASCTVTYTPGQGQKSMITITAAYSGDMDHSPSSGSTTIRSA